MTGRISPEIEDYIYANRDEFIGFSMRANAHKRMVAHQVNKEHSTEYDMFDVIATLEHLRKEGLLKEVGNWGKDQLYTVKADEEIEV
jgi:hypothetical protein